MTKKLKKKKAASLKKSNNAHTSKKIRKPMSAGYNSISKNNNKTYKAKKFEKNQKRLEKNKNKSYNKKVFNSFAFPDKPVVDYGILNKKNYLVVPNANEERKREDKYYSKTLFKLNRKGEIKQFILIQILQDRNTHRYTTYNRKGNFPK